MGQCGCGDFQGEFTLPAPGGGLYVFWRYRPCTYCGTPAGVVINYLGPDEIEDWSADGLPRMDLELVRARLIPVLAVESLAHAERGSKTADVYDDGEGYETIGDYLNDEGEQIIMEAMCSPVGSWADWEP